MCIWCTLSMFCCCSTLTSAKLGKIYLHNINCARIWNMCTYMRVHWSVMVHRKTWLNREWIEIEIHICIFKFQRTVNITEYLHEKRVVRLWSIKIYWSTLDSNPRLQKYNLYLVCNGKTRHLRPHGYCPTRRSRCFKLDYKYPSWYKCTLRKLYIG